MKKILYISTVICAALLSFACTKESEYTPGEAEDPNCAGVFFPVQEGVGGAFAPEDDFVFTVTASRTKSEGDITVPLVVYGNDDNIFTVPELSFVDGQTEQILEITFDKEKTPAGKEITLTLAIEDKAYSSIYSTNASFIAIPIIVENYKSLGMAEFYDEFEFGDEPFQVELLQNVENPDEFRLINPYKEGNEKYGYTAVHAAVEKLNFRIVQPGEVFNKGSKYEFTVKGEDLVWFDDFYTGDSAGADGDVLAYSPFVNSVYVLGTSESEVADNKVVNYQDPDADGVRLPAVVQLMPTYLLDDGSGRGWGAYPITIRFPGGEFVDYTLEVATEACVKGVVPASFYLGKDIASVKYQIYAGELTAKEIRQKTNGIGAGEEAAIDLDIANPDIDITLDETGIYTIVAVGFDKNDGVQANTSAVFGFVKPGDEESKAIVFDISIGQLAAEKAPYTNANSLQFNIVGTDITTVRYALVPTAGEAWQENRQAVIESVASYGTDLSADAVAQVNSVVGYSNVLSGLNPLTEYAFIVYAFNGYTGNTLYTIASTSGQPLQSLGIGTYTFWTGFEVEDDGETPLTTQYEWFFDPNTDDEYQVQGWCYDGTLYFSDNEEGVTVLASDTGYTYGGNTIYGIEFIDGINLFAQAFGYSPAEIMSIFGVEALADAHSYFNESDQLYAFCMMYFTTTGTAFGFGYDSFEIGDLEPASANPGKAVPASFDRSQMVASQFTHYALGNIEVERVVRTANFSVAPAKAAVAPSKGRKAAIRAIATR